MWERWQDAHRAMIPMALEVLGNVTSLYELGCGSGPNLRLLKYMSPELTLGGSEPCVGSAAWASEHLGVHIDPFQLPEAPKDRWDVFMTCYTLAYVEPKDVTEALTPLDARALILVEPMGDALGDPVGLCQVTDRGVPVGVPEWHHDYPALLAESGWRLTWRWPILPRVHGLNAILIAER